MEVIRTIGIVGGGQLGRMLTLAAKPLGFDVVVLDPGQNCPAAQVGAEQIVGNLYDTRALKKLARLSDVLTVEIEHLNSDALHTIAEAGTPVHPSPATIKLIQDKLAQKIYLQKAGVAVAPFVPLKTLKTARHALADFGGSMIVKTRNGAYDGRGNFVVSKPAELEAVFERFPKGQLYAEALVPFTKELSVIIARDRGGKSVLYPVAEMRHQRNICLEVQVPASIPAAASANALKLAQKVARHLKGAGVFAIEMFLLADNSVLVNEIAPRVHNSGHHTIEACVTSQFEQHIRAVSGLPLGKTDLTVPAASMVNILGIVDGPVITDFSKALTVPNSHIHWYGKSPVKVDRKMGHVTATGKSIAEASRRANQTRRRIKV